MCQSFLDLKNNCIIYWKFYLISIISKQFNYFFREYLHMTWRQFFTLFILFSLINFLKLTTEYCSFQTIKPSKFIFLNKVKNNSRRISRFLSISNIFFNTKNQDFCSNLKNLLFYYYFPDFRDYSIVFFSMKQVKRWIIF